MSMRWKHMRGDHSFSRARDRSRPSLETLERKELLSVSIHDFPLSGIPSGGSATMLPDKITSGPDGNLWFSTEDGRIGRISVGGVVTQFKAPMPGPIVGISAGPDGNVWFVEEANNKIGRIQPSGTITEFLISSDGKQRFPLDITSGPDGNLWFTESTGAIGRMTPSGSVTEYHLPTASALPYDITAGPDGNLWFTEDGAGAIGRISTSGAITEFSIPGLGASSSARVVSITSGLDGSLWFGVEGGNLVGRITPSGQIQEFPISSQEGATFWVDGASPGPDGNVWFTSLTTSQIFSVSSSGSVATYQTPTADPTGITWGSDNNLWVAETGGAIARVQGVSTVRTVSPVAVTGAVEDQWLSAKVATIVDTDPFDQASDYSATILWGDTVPFNAASTTPGTITKDGMGLYHVEGSTRYFSSGTENILVKIHNSRTGQDFNVSTTATVADAPLSSTGSSIGAFRGEALQSQILGRFVDTGVGGYLNTYKYYPPYAIAINWGDGSAQDVGQTSDTTNFGYSTQNWLDVMGNHVYVQDGSYTVHVTVSQGAESTSFTSAVNVIDPPISASITPVTALEGNSGNWEVASFFISAPNTTAADFSAHITWGDESSNGPDTQGTILSVGGAEFLVMRDRGFDTPSTIPFSVTVTYRGGGSFTVSGLAHIADQPLSGQANDFAGLSGLTLSPTLATFTDPALNANVADYTSSVDWGDGTSSTGLAVHQGASGAFTVGGSHMYATAGTYQVSVTINDIVGGTQSPPPPSSSLVVKSTATIAPDYTHVSGNTVTANEGDNKAWVLATFTPDPTIAISALSAEINWGNGLVESGTVRSIGGGQFVVSETHALNNPGTYQPVVTITSSLGLSTSATANVSVNDPPLQATGLSVAATQTINATAPVAWFTDPDPNAQASQYQTSIDWGDGNTSAGSVVRLSNGAFVVFGTHSYSDGGSESLTVSITDAKASVGTSPPANTVNVHGTAKVALEPISITATPGPIMGTQGVSLGSPTLATFTQPGNGFSAGDYLGLIDWGDHSGSVGTVVATPSGFAVQGDHAYINPGTYSVKVVVQGDTQTVFTNVSVVVNAVPVPLTGGLDPASDTGASNTDGITRDSTPRFLGATAANSPVEVIVVRVGATSPTYVGHTQSNLNGSWSVTTSPLPDGTYAAIALVQNATGYVRNQISLVRSGLVIDTAQPSVSVVSFSPNSGQVVVALPGDPAGLDPSSTLNSSSFVLRPRSGRGKTYANPTLSVSRTPGGPMTLVATFNGGRRLNSGKYSLMLSSGALRDLAGNSSIGANLLLSSSTTKSQRS
jgi:streptogramin lyase